MKTTLFDNKDITIIQNDGIEFKFHPAGWDFETSDIPVAAAIILGSNYEGKFDFDIEVKEFDRIDLVYWLSGGNRMWLGDYGYIPDEELRTLFEEIIRRHDNFDAIYSFKKFSKLIEYLRQIKTDVCKDAFELLPEYESYIEEIE